MECVGFCGKQLFSCLEDGLCAPCIEHEVCGSFTHHLLLLVQFLMPVLFSFLSILNHVQYGDERDTTVFVAALRRLDRNSSLGVLAVDDSGRPSTMVDGYEIRAVDVLYFVLPFALAVSVSSMTLVHLFKAHELSADQTYDDGLSETVISYELAYAAELLTFNVAYVAVAARPATLVEVVLGSGCLALIEMFFVITSRFPRNNVVEHHVAGVFLIALVGCEVLLLSSVIDYACWLNVASTAWFVVLTSGIVLVHFTANGVASTQSIVVTRVVGALLGCVGLLSVIGTGRDRVCL